MRGKQMFSGPAGVTNPLADSQYTAEGGEL